MRLVASRLLATVRGASLGSLAVRLLPAAVRSAGRVVGTSLRGSVLGLAVAALTTLLVAAAVASLATVALSAVATLSSSVCERAKSEACQLPGHRHLGSDIKPPVSADWKGKS